MSKSSVSRLWMEAGRKLVDELRTRDIASRDWLVLSKEQTTIVAIGVASDGTKHVWDFAFGSTGNYEAVPRSGEPPRRAWLRDTASALGGSSALRAFVKFFSDAAILR